MVGEHLRRQKLGVGLAGQSRPADQYLSGWTRDFFKVLARN